MNGTMMSTNQPVNRSSSSNHHGHHNNHRGNYGNNHHHHHQKQLRSYKLLVDPALVKGATKLYRYDGNDPTLPTVQLRDPRNNLGLTRYWTRLETLDLPVPRFKVCYVIRF